MAHVVVEGVLVEAGPPVQTRVVVAHALRVDDLAQRAVETCHSAKQNFVIITEAEFA